MACEGERRDWTAKTGDRNVSWRKSSFATYYYDNTDYHKLLWPPGGISLCSRDLLISGQTTLFPSPPMPWLPSPFKSHLASRLFSYVRKAASALKV